MKRTKKEIIKQTEEWLDERWAIKNMGNPPRQADVSYYNGAIAAVEWLGYEWIRTDGKHKLFK